MLFVASVSCIFLSCRTDMILLPGDFNQKDY